MVSQHEQKEEASDATEVVAELASTHYREAVQPEVSPCLSLDLTPALSYITTPDTPYLTYNDFSPRLGDNSNSVDCFGNDYPIFSGDFAVDSVPQTVGYGLFQDSPVDPLSHGFFDPATSAPSKELFVSPCEIEATPMTQDCFSDPILPAYSSANAASAALALPSTLIRSKSDSAVFAVPKLPRGRKRKSSVDDSVSKPTKSPLLPDQGAFEGEDDEKVRLRAKNTESAARSRLRKKLELKEAQQKTQDLEQELHAVKLESARKDAFALRRIQELERQVNNLLAELETKNQLLSAFQ